MDLIYHIKGTITANGGRFGKWLPRLSGKICDGPIAKNLN